MDVRDVADALLLAYEHPLASGRYLCNSSPIRVSDIVNILKSSFPTYIYPTKSLMSPIRVSVVVVVVVVVVFIPQSKRLPQQTIFFSGMMCLIYSLHR